MKNIFPEIDRNFFQFYNEFFFTDTEYQPIEDWGSCVEEPDSEEVAELVKEEETYLDKIRLLADLEKALFPEAEDNSVIFSKTANRRNYKTILSFIHKVQVMKEIKFIWETENDFSFTDEWFLNRSDEYLRTLYSLPTDEIAELMPSIDLHGMKLAYSSFLNGLCVRDNEEDLHRIYRCKECYDFKALTPEDMSIPFEAHSIWDALLLLMSSYWMWKPMMYIAGFRSRHNHLAMPRVTIFGDKALATFWTINMPNKDDDYCDSDYCGHAKNAILVQKWGNSFKILGGYYKYWDDFPGSPILTNQPLLPDCNMKFDDFIKLKNIPKAPEKCPPLHHFTDEEIRRVNPYNIVPF